MTTPTDTTRYFQSRFIYDRKRGGVWQVICRYLQPYVPLDGRVLDVGAGYCDFINHIRTGGKTRPRRVLKNPLRGGSGTLKTYEPASLTVVDGSGEPATGSSPPRLAGKRRDERA